MSWAFALHVPSTPQEAVDPVVRAQQMRAYSGYGADAGLEAAATVTGTFTVKLEACNDAPVNSIGDLVKFSDAIVTGTFGSSAARLESKLTIVTDYRVTVDRVLKGGLKTSDTIDVAILGGTVTFPGGETATVITPDALQPAPAQRFMLFLRTANEREKASYQAARHAAGESIVYHPVAGCHGEYPVDKNGRLVAFGLTGANNSVAHGLAGKSETAAVSAVRKLVGGG